jgi:hypothetical protein
MTSKEKAIELVNSCNDLAKDFTRGVSMNEFSKQFALLMVEEIIREYQSMSDLESTLVVEGQVLSVIDKLVYWMEVKRAL